jgi:hypothetical protein
MYQMTIPPYEPRLSEPVRPPMVFVEKSLKWEYRQIVRNLKKESPLDEAELNALGQEGWEMSGIVHESPLAYFYFKRLIET